MITVVVGKEIEKIKGDYESYLSGLNMVGEISYSQYSELYDEGTKQIQRAYELGKSELEKENALLKADLEFSAKMSNKNKQTVKEYHKLVDEYSSEGADLQDRIKTLEKENVELKSKVDLSIDCKKAQKNGKLCLGYGGDEDEPCEQCKNCIKCECGYYQLGETEKDEQLTKAKELLKEYYSLTYGETMTRLRGRTEKFLNGEVEKMTETNLNKNFQIPRHYIEEYASLVGKTYWELLDEIKYNIDKNKAEQFISEVEK